MKSLISYDEGQDDFLSSGKPAIQKAGGSGTGSKDKLFNGRPLFSVTQLSLFLRDLLYTQPSLRALWIEGEVSNLTKSSRGHFYFKLKDQNSILQAVVFADSPATATPPREGEKILAFGNVEIYPKNGVYQLIVDRILPRGRGDLYLKFEQLKEKLSAEGLFSIERKRPLPQFPKRIAILTSPTGAAIQDFIRVSHDFFPPRRILVHPVEVQGERAAADMVRALDFVNSRRVELGVEVIVMARGGGSIEDLWAYNEEILVRAVAGSALPVVTGVGHETDFTLCDLAADARASTPSKAAQLVFPNWAREDENVSRLEESLGKNMARMLDGFENRLKLAAASRALTDRKTNIHMLDQRIDDMEARLRAAFSMSTQKKDAKLTKLSGMLETLSPYGVLGRGYAILSTREGKVLTGAAGMKKGMEIGIMMGDGWAEATVDTVTLDGTRAGTHKNDGKSGESVKECTGAVESDRGHDPDLGRDRERKKDVPKTKHTRKSGG